MPRCWSSTVARTGSCAVSASMQKKVGKLFYLFVNSVTCLLNRVPASGLSSLHRFSPPPGVISVSAGPTPGVASEKLVIPLVDVLSVRGHDTSGESEQPFQFSISFRLAGMTNDKGKILLCTHSPRDKEQWLVSILVALTQHKICQRASSSMAKPLHVSARGAIYPACSPASIPLANRR